MQKQLKGELSGLSDILTEQELSKLFGISEKKVSGLRYKGMPWIKVTERVRLYSVPHLLRWFEGRIRKIQSDENSTQNDD